MASVTVDTGMTIEYDIRGEGEPILFVMGLGGQLIDWREEFVDRYVEQGYQAIRFDNRDIGLSSKTDWDPPGLFRRLLAMLTRRKLKNVQYTIDDMAADAVGLLNELEIGKAHVVGMSMGGMIAQAMATNHPDKVASLCSIMSNTGDGRNGGIAGSLMRELGRQPEPTRENAVDQSVKLFRAISGDHFDEAVHRERMAGSLERSFDPGGIDRQSAAIAGSPDRTEALGNVSVPTLVIHGLQDRLVKPSGGIATAEAIPGSRLLMFPDMGHDLPLPRWDEIRDAIVANIERVRTAQTV